IGNQPLQLWSEIANEESSHIQRVTDDMISSSVIEIVSPNLSNTYITCPAQLNRTLAIKLPYIVFVVKNLDKYFSFEIEVLDDHGTKQRFRASNYQSITRVKPYITTMPMRLDPGWNQVVFHLADCVKRAYGTNYAETTRVTVHANCRLRRIYFTDRLYSEEELPAEFKLFLPVEKPA
ncbi:Cilia- and flagella-associated protein 20, partial [Apophysomyces sp. BC1015]